VVVLGVQDDERPVGELFPEVVRGADPGDPCPDDEDVDVLGLGTVAAWLLDRCRFGGRRHGGTSSVRVVT
jgi:hypothetical protein